MDCFSKFTWRVCQKEEHPLRTSVSPLSTPNFFSSVGLNCSTSFIVTINRCYSTIKNFLDYLFEVSAFLSGDCLSRIFDNRNEKIWVL